jgi:hypothetical protein
LSELSLSDPFSRKLGRWAAPSPKNATEDEDREAFKIRYDVRPVLLVHHSADITGNGYLDGAEWPLIAVPASGKDEEQNQPTVSALFGV